MLTFQGLGIIILGLGAMDGVDGAILGPNISSFPFKEKNIGFRSNFGILPLYMLRSEQKVKGYELGETESRLSYL